MDCINVMLHALRLDALRLDALQREFRFALILAKKSRVAINSWSKLEGGLSRINATGGRSRLQMVGGKPT